jgi:hypothetical protein
MNTNYDQPSLLTVERHSDNPYGAPMAHPAHEGATTLEKHIGLYHSRGTWTDRGVWGKWFITVKYANIQRW